VTSELTIGRWLADRARLTPERVAIRFLGGELTYAELDSRATRLAASLRARGLGRGDRLATLTHTSPDHVATLFACARLGVALQPISWRLAPAEVAYQLADAEPSLLLVSAEHEELAHAAASDTVSLAASSAASRSRAGVEVARIGDPTLEADGEVEDVARDDDPLLLVYTSGTTGKPKGALLTHANCFWTNLSFDRTTSLRDDDVVLQVLPQFHVGGWNVQPLLAWWKGATVVLEPSFDAARALELIAEHGVTTMMGVPATYLFLSEQEGFATADLSSLRLAVVGGAPMPESLLETWHARGIEVVQGYGLTEAAPNVLCLPPEDAKRKLGFAGKPYPHVEVALRDADTGAFLDGAATGELVVRGPNVFAGYWRNDEATAAALTDGWLSTGDVAERDEEGFYRIAGRIKDMVISGGENVYPAEIEDVLHAHPDIVEAAVVGVPDERWGEACAAFVVLRDGATASAETLAEHCRARLARFKVPKTFTVVDELPRSSMGKVSKDDLRASLAETAR
jgi:fatty-acyl-CoA synthase